MKRTLTYTADRGCSLSASSLRAVVADMDKLGVHGYPAIHAVVRPDRKGAMTGYLRQLKIETSR